LRVAPQRDEDLQTFAGVLAERLDNFGTFEGRATLREECCRNADVA